MIAQITRQALIFESTMDSSTGLSILGISLTILSILADFASAEGASESSETGPKGKCTVHCLFSR